MVHAQHMFFQLIRHKPEIIIIFNLHQAMKAQQLLFLV